ncbi:hypothetical protein M8J77_009033 [Diaphorina citri]|nr:hypothetical protein M8J77_009033 [Diaphorina citri]
MFKIEIDKMADGSQEFCLRWNNHQATIISVFDYLLENETLVDCTLAAEGQYLKAHKVVLCACSPYLEILLSQHNDKHPILIFKDIKFTELKSMIDYMYKGEVNIAQDQLNHFLKAAESLQIKGLSESEDEAAPQTAVPTPRPPPPRAPPAQRTQPRPFSNAVAIRSTGPDEDSPKRVIGRSDAQSPTPRKRRRQAPLGLQGRPSLSDDASNASDGHYDQANCDVPTPALTSTPSAPSSDTASDKAVAKVETNSELMLEPKTEYDDNDNSVEDITLDDDDEDYSQAGTSQLDNSQGNFGSWQQMVGDQSTDNFSGQDTGAQNSQGKLSDPVQWG